MEKKKELSKYERQSQERIIELIRDYCNNSQHNFCQRTGLNKGSVSQYVNGKNSPSNLSANKIADAFNVSVMWVMGFDVPKTDSTTGNISKSGIGKALLKSDKDNPILQKALLDMKLESLNINQSDVELLSLCKNLTEDKRVTLIEIAVRLANGGPILLCNNSIEEDIIISYRNTTKDLQFAVRQILGVKGDSESEMENAMNG